MSDYQVGDTIHKKFTSRAFATGIPTTLAGTPVVSVYEDDSVTQITAGITLTADFDGVTGLNNLTIVATGGNGFETGKYYSAVITTGTVGGVSVVGEEVLVFTLEASAAALDLANGTDGLTALKTAIDDVPTNSEFNTRTLASADYFDSTTDNVTVGTNNDKTGYSISGTKTTLDALNDFDATSDTVANVTTVATTTTNTDMRGTDGANTVAPDNASITDILADTNELQLNQGNWLTATGFSTSAEIAALNDISVNDILTTQMTESYAADGIAPTLAQGIFLTMQNLQDFSFAGTTQTVKKIDGTSTAATYTLDDAVTPTSKTRAT